MNNFPNFIDISELKKFVDEGFDLIVTQWGERIEYFSLPLLYILEWVEKLFLGLPWWVVVVGIAVLSYSITKKLFVTLALVMVIFLVGVIGVWQPAMESVALMLTSTLIAVVLGIPIGIAISRSRLLNYLVSPVLDIMQTMPIFVYLIPFVMLLGPGKVPALLATVVFAIPPVIRMTALGIRQVNVDVIEAYTSFGATGRQILWNVQLPLALPSIMAGVNQTTMMALSMVVIASMIGAGGLGYQVLQGIQRLEVSRGLLAGLGIVFIAIVFDRIAQSYGKMKQKHLSLDDE